MRTRPAHIVLPGKEQVAGRPKFIFVMRPDMLVSVRPLPSCVTAGFRLTVH